MLFFVINPNTENEAYWCTGIPWIRSALSGENHWCRKVWRNLLIEPSLSGQEYKIYLINGSTSSASSSSTRRRRRKYRDEHYADTSLNQVQDLLC